MHVDFYHGKFCELILFCMYLKDDTFKLKTMCISNWCAPSYQSIKGHCEKNPKHIFLTGGAHQSVHVKLYPSPLGCIKRQFFSCSSLLGCWKCLNRHSK